MAKKEQTKGFVLGNHQFFDPVEGSPGFRFDDPKKQILGAQPPTFLEGLVRESTKDSASAKQLLKGEFCGHGEPTMTVFDFVIDGAEELHIDGIFDDTLSEEEIIGDEDGNGGGAGFVSLLAVRKPGGPWHIVFRREWESKQTMLEGVKAGKLSAAEAAKLSGQPLIGRLSIGFEYPCDATSRDSVTWMTLDILEKGKRKPMSVIDIELA